MYVCGVYAHARKRERQCVLLLFYTRHIHVTIILVFFQNCSGQSSESTGPPGSPQESVEEGAGAVFSPQYVYTGYMYGPPFYNVNGKYLYFFSYISLCQKVKLTLYIHKRFQNKYMSGTTRVRYTSKPALCSKHEHV